MKRLLLIIFAAGMMASCSSDDDSSSENSIVGTWILTEANLAIPVDINQDGTQNRDVLDEFPCFEGSVNFEVNETYTRRISTVIPVNEGLDCGPATTNSGTYELNGDQLTITESSGETTTATVDLNGNTLSGNFEFQTYGNVELVFQKN
ncbi:lipocalin-like domain-containing protein [Aequorivita echinoideorum]|uniref:DUF5004 domain-containing protein n=1 Tax=Aequorivita echinoideorum TaxID=1549647 RepID=A0ABS5S3I7_9FLAO|nr:lipocalin family protein [Aequorivita echinoideorum]MBT0607771.1 DUF5004 domain-containing protein [Aequorivita echinoideorum]